MTSTAHRVVFCLLACLLATALGGQANCSDPPASSSTEEALHAAATRSQESRGPGWPSAPEDGAPLLVTFESLIDDDASKRAQLRFYNYGERDIALVEMSLEYLSETGNVLKTFPWKATPSLPARTHARHIVGAFLPPETVRVRPTIRSVRFADGSSWAPDPAVAPPAP